MVSLRGVTYGTCFMARLFLTPFMYLQQGGRITRKGGVEGGNAAVLHDSQGGLRVPASAGWPLLLPYPK